MKIKENVTLYICEHCRKKYQKENFCIQHEFDCTKNPKNFAACQGCDFIKSTKTTVYYDMFDGEHSISCNSFFCDKLQKGVYPYKVVRTGILDKHPETFEDQIQMPVTCEFFKPEKYFI
ncbi:MAG: hypothetical protein V4538_15760 [Bacteroidota bacterium]